MDKQRMRFVRFMVIGGALLLWGLYIAFVGSVDTETTMESRAGGLAMKDRLLRAGQESSAPEAMPVQFYVLVPPQATVTIEWMPTATTVPTPTVTVTPTATFTPTPTPTATTVPPPPGGFSNYIDEPIGGHAWGYTFDVYDDYPQDGNVLGVLVPSQMTQAGYTWADVATFSGYYGVADSVWTDRLENASVNHAPYINAVVYVPEGRTTSGQVPISETIYLTTYLDLLLDRGEQYSLTVFYGPSLELISDPDTWEWGTYYDLDCDLVTSLASRMPDDAFWITRMYQAEFICQGPTQCYQDAVYEVIDCIQAGNPDLGIVGFISLPAGEEDDFLGYRQLIVTRTHMTYWGPDPTRQITETIQTMHNIFATAHP